MANIVAMKEAAMKLIANCDYEMASVYYEQAGDAALLENNKDEAMSCYREALECFRLLEREDLIAQITRKIESLSK